jgi:7,8-dihydropterin-6-yl-methyl-4-(beta-D-ribofuranosyl)aminobenzene 5'-phosphate synthase
LGGLSTGEEVNLMKRILLAAILISTLLPFASIRTDVAAHLTAANQSKPNRRVSSLRVLVLSTMLADAGIGEWGFAALVEVDGHRILFDTGARPDTVLKNARELGVDLAGVSDVVLSHNHGDHTGGLLHLRRELAKENPAALSRAHVGKGIFWSRPRGDKEGNPMIGVKPAYEAAGGSFIEHDEPAELHPGVWLTGPVPRVFPERNWPSGTRPVKTPQGLAEDTLPEDMSLVFDTDKGLVVLSGCGHAGIINTFEHARSRIRRAPAYAAIGGFHLFELDDGKLAWTAAKLREFGLRHLLGGHCTGIEAVYRLRQLTGLDRRTCVVSAVGSSFTLDKGIDPLDLAR